MPPGNSGWLEWMEPEDLTNSILVSFLSVFISTLTICVSVRPFHTADQLVLVEPLYSTSWWSMTRYSSWLSMEALSVAALHTVWATARVARFVKATPYVLPLRAKECAGKHRCWRATVRNVCRQQHPSWGFCGRVGSFWLSWVKARLLPLDFSKGLAWDDSSFTAAPPKYESQSHSVLHINKVIQVWRLILCLEGMPELQRMILSVNRGNGWLYITQKRANKCLDFICSSWTER